MKMRFWPYEWPLIVCVHVKCSMPLAAILHIPLSMVGIACHVKLAFSCFSHSHLRKNDIVSLKKHRTKITQPKLMILVLVYSSLKKFSAKTKPTKLTIPLLLGHLVYRTMWKCRGQFSYFCKKGDVCNAKANYTEIDFGLLLYLL